MKKLLALAFALSLFAAPAFALEGNGSSGAGNGGSNVSAPITGSGSVGNPITCPTCATTTNGGAITGTAPITVSAGGAVGLSPQYFSYAFTAPVQGNFTVVNQGTATLTWQSGFGLNYTDSHAGDSITFLYIAAPATPYSITITEQFVSQTVGFGQWGLGWSDGTKFHVVAIQDNNSSGAQLNVAKWTNGTTFSANDTSNTAWPKFSPFWLKVVDDGTNVSFKWSMDGTFYVNLFTVAKASGFLGSSGYSRVGLFFNANSSSTMYNTVLNWTQGTN